MKIEKYCELRTFLKDQHKDFYRGCAFYEFKNRTEDIEKGKRIILVEKVSVLFVSHLYSYMT